jgi:hypothetical protein
MKGENIMQLSNTVFEVGDKVRSTIDSKAMGADWLAVIIERVSDECFITAGRWFPYAKDDPRYNESAMLNPNTWANFDPNDTTLTAMQLRATSLEHCDHDIGDECDAIYLGEEI